MPHMVECAEGGMKPALLVCKHIADGTAKLYVAIDVENSQMHDYLCNYCFLAVRDDSLDIDELLAVCFHCAKPMLEGMTEIKAEWDTAYGEYGTFVDPADLDDELRA